MGSQVLLFYKEKLLETWKILPSWYIDHMTFRLDFKIVYPLKDL